MRKLNTQDAFKTARIVRYTGLKQMVIDAYKNDKKFNREELGVEIIFALIDACGDAKVESDFYALIGGITEKGADAIREQSLDVTIADLKQIFEENDMASFFGSFSSLV